VTAWPLGLQGYRYSRVQNNLFLGSRGKNDNPVTVKVRSGQDLDLNHNGWLMRNVHFGYEDKTYPNFNEFFGLSGKGQGGISANFQDFVNAPNPHIRDKTPPHNVHLFDPEQIDLRLAEGSNAIDAGTIVPNVNEDYEGDAPDLGAYEKGRPIPHYGPRTELPGEWYWTEPEKYADAELDTDAPGEAVLRVACGSPWPYKDPAGRIWQGDQPYEWPAEWGFYGNENAWYNQRKRGKDAGAPLTGIYGFERSSLDSYTFDLPDGEYVVRMHFMERWGEGRVFNVVVNNETALDDFEVFQVAGGNNKPVVRDARTTVKGGKLLIEFVHESGGSPIINGIEIFRVGGGS
jgi:hypothetical protein